MNYTRLLCTITADIRFLAEIGSGRSWSLKTTTNLEFYNSKAGSSAGVTGRNVAIESFISFVNCRRQETHEIACRHDLLSFLPLHLRHPVLSFSGEFIDVILKMEEMLKSWFPHVKPQVRAEAVQTEAQDLSKKRKVS